MFYFTRDRSLKATRRIRVRRISTDLPGARRSVENTHWSVVVREDGNGCHGEPVNIYGARVAERLSVDHRGFVPRQQRAMLCRQDSLQRAALICRYTLAQKKKLAQIWTRNKCSYSCNTYEQKA